MKDPLERSGGDDLAHLTIAATTAFIRPLPAIGIARGHPQLIGTVFEFKRFDW